MSVSSKLKREIEWESLPAITPAEPNPSDMIIVHTMVNVIHQAKTTAKTSFEHLVSVETNNCTKQAYEVGRASP